MKSKKEIEEYYRLENKEYLNLAGGLEYSHFFK
jgi:hypothetical protein